MENPASDAAGCRSTRLIRFLVESRGTAKLSQAQIGDALRLAQPDVSKIERLERRIDAVECFQWLQATSRAQGVNPRDAWLLLYDCLKEVDA